MNRTVFARLLGLLCLLAFAPLLSAQTYSMSGTTVANYPASGPRYVIDADRANDVPEFSNPFFARWYVTGTTTLSASATGPFSTLVQIRMRLVNSAGVTVPCENANASGYVSDTSFTFSGGFGTTSATRTVNLVPTVRLDPYDFYRVEAIATAGRSGTIASQNTANSFRFAHFTGPNGTDAEFNVITYLENNPTYGQTYLVATDPANDDFIVNAPYTLYRFDEPQTIPQSTNIGLRFTVELYDNTAPGTPIALQQPQTVIVVPMQSYNTAFLQIPTIVTGTQTLRFRPAAGVQLDSPGKTYFAKVTVEHVERLGIPPLTPLIVTGNSRTLGGTRFLHFNGRLTFGPNTANPINTTLTSVTNNPQIGGVVVAGPPQRFDTSLLIAGASVDGTAHTFTANPAATVSLLANGNAIIRGSASVTLTPPSTPDRGTIGGVRFDRGSITLDINGGSTATLSTILPAGMGWAPSATDKTVNPRFSFTNVQLGQQLTPTLTSLTWFPSGSSAFVTEESKPMAVRVTSVAWTVATGRFDLNAVANPSYVRTAEYSQLEGSPVPAAQLYKRSNEQYWRWAQFSAGTSYFIKAGLQGGAEFTGKFNVSNATAQLYRSHFPYDATMKVGSGTLIFAADVMDGATSALVLAAGSTTVTMPWLNGCLDPSCDPSGAPSTAQTFTPDSATLRVTADGGLVAKGTFAATLDLKWGFIPSLGVYAHKVNTPFANGTFAVGGFFLRGADLNLASVNDGPAAMLYTGVDAATGAVTERPGTAGYANGRAEYAGYNLSLGANDANDSGIKGQSTLAGVAYGPYALKNRCKWYVRSGGVTGIQDKVAGPSQNITLYGYKFTLTNFGLSFLDNGVRDSRVNGKVVVPDPSNIFVDFAELKFFCNGGLDKAQIANTTPPQTMAYWQAPIDIQSLQFLQPDSCSVSEGYLTLGLVSYSSHIVDPLIGTVGFLSNGNLINKAFSDAKGGGLLGLDSRFKMPKQVKFQGPKRQTTQGGFEDYVFTPVVDAYLNVTGTAPNFTHNPAGAPTGFWNFGGKLKVAFFETPKIHLQTTANRPPADPNQPSAWQTSVIQIANGKWDTGANTTTFFDAANYHDTWNRGYPYPVSAGGSGESLQTYFTSPNYMTIARQAWLGGAVEFKYKLQWNSSTRSFTSLDASQSQDSAAEADLAQKMVILKIDHRLPYLSAERAELTFGASYSGLPKINLANFVVNQLDDAAGVFKAATQAGCGAIFNSLEEGLQSLAKMLNDQLRDYFNATLDPLIQPVSGSLYLSLKNVWNGAGVWDQTTIDPLLDNVFGPVGSVTSGIKGALKGVGGAADQLQQIRNYLNQTVAALDTINNQFLTPNGNGDLPLARNLARELIKVLSQEIGGTLGSLVGGAGIDQKLGDILDPLLKDAQPSLLDLRTALVKLRELVVQVRDAANVGGTLAKELIDIANAQAAEIDTVASGARTELRNFLLNTFAKATPGKNFLARSEAEIRAKIENAIYDRFFGTQLIGKIQTAIKHRLQDVEVAIRSGLDSAFGEVNKLIKKTISGLLAEVDESINGVLGEFSDYVGSGSIQGYATFNGDALRKLRVDGRFQFKVPDPTNVEAFLEINQYTSKDKPPGCYQPAGNDTLTEVIIGAHNVPCDFLTPGVKINLDAKFSFVTQGSGKGSIQPVGLAGGLEMVKGPINYEAFKITKLAVGIAFGKTENYFSAALGLRMGSYGATGGIFFGRTCSIAPIKLWDPFAAKVLGEPNPTFSGIYVYGEVHIPVSEVLLGIPATCFFEINADAGVGFFVFAEGPTYGARMALGVDGHVLCILGISGRVDLIGGKVNGKTKLAGRGEFCASILFIDVCKDVEIGTTVQSDGALKGKGDAH